MSANPDEGNVCIRVYSARSLGYGATVCEEIILDMGASRVLQLLPTPEDYADWISYDVSYKHTMLHEKRQEMEFDLVIYAMDNKVGLHDGAIGRIAQRYLDKYAEDVAEEAPWFHSPAQELDAFNIDARRAVIQRLTPDDSPFSKSLVECMGKKYSVYAEKGYTRICVL